MGTRIYKAGAVLVVAIVVCDVDVVVLAFPRRMFVLKSNNEKLSFRKQEYVIHRLYYFVFKAI